VNSTYSNLFKAGKKFKEIERLFKYQQGPIAVMTSRVPITYTTG
jgi:hypothetical protein